jgi:hypothetical protein
MGLRITLAPFFYGKRVDLIGRILNLDLNKIKNKQQG